MELCHVNSVAPNLIFLGNALSFGVELMRQIIYEPNVTGAKTSNEEWDVIKVYLDTIYCDNGTLKIKLSGIVVAQKRKEVLTVTPTWTVDVL